MISALRLANWNVNRPVAQSRVAAVRAAIDAVGADIIVLTETHDGLALDFEYRLASLPGRDGNQGEQHRWVSIHSRFPLQALPTSDVQRTVAARIDLGVSAVIVFGIVLPWKNSSWRDTGPRDAFQAALNMQMDDVARLRDAFPEDELFVIGDFNQDLCGGRYSGAKWKAQLLQASLDNAGQIPITAGENDPVRRTAPPYACIDHICLSRNGRWQAGEVRCWPDSPSLLAGLSDHFGIVADLLRRPA